MVVVVVVVLLELVLVLELVLELVVVTLQCWEGIPEFPATAPPGPLSLTVNSKVIPLIIYFINIRVIVITKIFVNTVSMIDIITNLMQSSEYLLVVLLISIVGTLQGLN